MFVFCGLVFSVTENEKDSHQKCYLLIDIDKQRNVFFISFMSFLEHDKDYHQQCYLLFDVDETRNVSNEYKVSTRGRERKPMRHDCCKGRGRGVHAVEGKGCLIPAGGFDAHVPRVPSHAQRYGQLAASARQRRRKAKL